MKHPFDLNGKLFYVSESDFKEIANGYKGRYLIINLERAVTEKRLFFEKGKYTIDDVSSYQQALAEFGEKVIEKLAETRDIHNYQVFIKGSADLLGNDTYEGYFRNSYEYETICILEKEPGKNLFRSIENCYEISEPFYNSDLPNLRGAFLAEMFKNYYSSLVTPIILDGDVSFQVSSSDRNVIVYLFIADSFFWD